MGAELTNAGVEPASTRTVGIEHCTRHRLLPSKLLLTVCPDGAIYLAYPWLAVMNM